MLPFEYITVPSEVEIQTIRSLYYETDDSTLLVRIRSLSTSSMIDLNLISLFEHFEIQSVIETSLTLLYNKSSSHSSLHFNSDESNKLSHYRDTSIPYSSISGDKISYLNKNYELTLYPMEIKTFLLTIKPSKTGSKPKEEQHSSENEDISKPIYSPQQPEKTQSKTDKTEIPTSYKEKEVKAKVEEDEEVISTWSLYMPTMLFFIFGGVIIIFGRGRNRRKLGRIIKELISKIKPKKTARLVV